MAYPYMQPAYAPPAPKPGGGTAITAGVSALLQGIALTVFSVLGAIATRQDRRSGDGSTEDLVALIIFGSRSSLFLVGAILLLCRRKSGRFIVVAVTSLVLLVVPVFPVVAAIGGGVEKSDVVGFAVMLALLFAVELPTLVCAAMSSTGRWIAARTVKTHVPPAPVYPYY
ncbi:hypothetical protein [Nocardia cerradoensis]|uniref:hypothetical protein n=1 Tax=Nocardia cerradoensis TaxID=85688 RepID=UPI00031FBB17|nr:hypothetical protein [Nocardia cerradoensis]NKY47193.1 hypothetical protein [Nocardia cerradoensis]